MDAAKDALCHLSSHKKRPPFIFAEGCKSVEMTMSTTTSASISAQRLPSPSWATGLTTTVKHGWDSLRRWRMHRAAASELWSMSDRELKDIGLNRSQIIAAVAGDVTRDYAISHYY
jgi:uncharacterized protein YjiS (DUF1127 family)